MSGQSEQPAAGLQVHPGVDPVKLAPVLRARRRLHIQNFLSPDGARSLARDLQSAAEWSLVTHPPLEPVAPSDDGSEPRQTVTRHAYGAARGGSAYLYERISSSEGNSHNGDVALLAGPAGFFNSREFLTFARTLTGYEDLARADICARRYRPGHFVTFRVAAEGANRRRVVFVYSSSTEWKPEWGGLLEFKNPEGHIAEGFVPRFNSLSLFLVPQDYGVSFVSPGAAANQYTLEGSLY